MWVTHEPGDAIARSVSIVRESGAMPGVRPIVVMGVAGSGKSTVGRLLADRLGAPFIEGDELHPPANVAKMTEGVPLTDEDRAPWLALVADRIARDAAPDRGVVVSCSALRRRDRDLLRSAGQGPWFVHIAVDPVTATERVAGRKGHFMPDSLVESQFRALEPLLPDEHGLTVDTAPEPDQVVSAILAHWPPGS